MFFEVKTNTLKHIIHILLREKSKPACKKRPLRTQNARSIFCFGSCWKMGCHGDINEETTAKTRAKSNFLLKKVQELDSTPTLLVLKNLSIVLMRMNFLAPLNRSLQVCY